jgi:hypothetical protein
MGEGITKNTGGVIMAKDPQAVLAAYRSGVSSGGTKYQTGVKAAAGTWQQQATSEASEARYAEGVARAAAQKARQKALQQVSGQQWADAAANQGASNYTRAADRAGTNYEKQLPDILAAGDRAQAAARAIPGASLADRLQRPAEAAKATHRYWMQKKGLTPEV